MTAERQDAERVCAFYREAAEKTPEMALCGRRIRGLHPTRKMIESHGGDPEAGEDDRDIDWGTAVPDEVAAVIHLPAVSPFSRGQGIGRAPVREAVRIAETDQKAALPPDEPASNFPVHRVYETPGFSLRGRKTMRAENTGDTEFLFFEKLL